MSHQPERKEKDCLNCGTLVQGRFCHHCGQENIVNHQSFWALTKHFVYDILHFDGKFFDTLRILLTKPGSVPKQYTSGKRASFLDPIRMYLFTSALFFLVLFSIKNPKTVLGINRGQARLTIEARDSLRQVFESGLRNRPDDTALIRKIALLKDTSRPIMMTDLYEESSSAIFTDGKKLHSIREYDSAQSMLPPQKRDGWFKRAMVHKSIKFDNKYNGNFKSGMQELSESFIRKLPYLLFISLPFFAILLKLLYIRRKNYFYSDHAVFTLYHYIFSFILFLFVLGFIEARKATHFAVFDWVINLIFLYGGLYLLFGMKRFYSQSWGKTIAKFLLLNLAGAVVLFLLFAVFFFLSVFQL